MDTKWRKWKLILSFTAFFLGITLLFGNFLSMMGLLMSQDGDTLADRVGTDYQNREEFCWSMSDRLEELLGVATGGKGWRNYGAVYSDGGVLYYGNAYGRSYSYSTWADTSGEAVVQEAVAAPPEELGLPDLEGRIRELEKQVEDGILSDDEADEIIAEYEAEYERAGEALTERSWAYQEELKPETLEKHMEELAGDKNILYAVLYQGKLLYTNIDEARSEVGKEVGAKDYSNYVSEEEYNFFLWYNLMGDGKVQITKDGQSLDVYGDGVYREDSRWYVPGYTNFSTDPSAKDAVIFMAAAKEPKLYITGNYSGSGTIRQGGQLYYMQRQQMEWHRRYETGLVRLGCALLLLILAFLMRRSRKEADRAIGAFLGKIWIEVKVLLFVGVPLVLLWTNGRELLRELIWMLEDGGWYYVEESLWYIGRFMMNGTALAVAFWMIYLAVLDRRYNKGRQKLLTAPVLYGLGRKNLELPIQRRMVSRYYPVLAFSLLFPFFGIASVFGLFFVWGWDGTTILLTALAVLSGVGFVAATVVYLCRNKQLATDLGALAGQIADVREGNLTKPLELSGDADLKAAAENLNEIQQGMETALKEQTKSERMKVELVANVSHDIKTPLTSIISYVELLKQEEELPDHVREYVQILGEKSERLKNMVQDVFEVSKAASNQLPVNMEKLDLAKLLRQTLAVMIILILVCCLAMKVSLPEEPVLILADGQRLYRVFQNLLQNALKYSLKGSRIFLVLAEEGKTAAASIKNTSGVEIDGTVDFTERFVRGDISRTDGGSGLGLSIARSFTEACGGSFDLDVNADLFTVTVRFEKVSQ